jgi:hypothetical protein
MSVIPELSHGLLERAHGNKSRIAGSLSTLIGL